MTDELPNFVGLMALHHTALVFESKTECSQLALCASEANEQR